MPEPKQTKISITDAERIDLFLKAVPDIHNRLGTLMVKLDKLPELEAKLDKLISELEDVRTRLMIERRAPEAKPASTKAPTCNRCGASLRAKDGKIDWLKLDGKFYPQDPTGGRHYCMETPQ